MLSSAKLVAAKKTKAKLFFLLYHNSNPTEEMRVAA
jgi:hypothetical protein